MKKIDISDDVEFKNGRANGLGWVQEEVWYRGQKIGWLVSGYLQDLISPISI